MSFLYLKALHIIFVVTWFAGLFYIVRLFIYQTEAHEKSEQEKAILLPQYKLMARRLWYGITWPSAIVTLGFGLSLLHAYNFQIPNWLWIKLAFVAGLYVYHYSCHRIFKQLQNDEVRYSSQQLRIWNEVATIFLFAIVFLVILRSALQMVWGLIGMAVFIAVLMAGIMIYRKVRQKNSGQ